MEPPSPALLLKAHRDEGFDTLERPRAGLPRSPAVAKTTAKHSSESFFDQTCVRRKGRSGKCDDLARVCSVTGTAAAKRPKSGPSAAASACDKMRVGQGAISVGFGP